MFKNLFEIVRGPDGMKSNDILAGFAYVTVLRPSFCLSSVICDVLWLNGASYSKSYLTAYRKSYMRNRLVP